MTEKEIKKLAKEIAKEVGLALSSDEAEKVFYAKRDNRIAYWGAIKYMHKLMSAHIMFNMDKFEGKEGNHCKLDELSLGYEELVSMFNRFETNINIIWKDGLINPIVYFEFMLKRLQDLDASIHSIIDERYGSQTDEEREEYRKKYEYVRSSIDRLSSIIKELIDNHKYLTKF